MDKFQQLGINPNNPYYGTWWEGADHLHNWYAYDQVWVAFFEKYPIDTITKDME